MLVLGFVLLALAVAAAIVAIVQNPHVMVNVDVLGANHSMHAYWVFVAGMVVLAVAAIGISMMRAGAAYTARRRRERRDLAAENARLSQRAVQTPVMTQPVTDERMAGQPVATDREGRAYADDSSTPTRHTWGRRSHRTV